MSLEQSIGVLCCLFLFVACSSPEQSKKQLTKKSFEKAKIENLFEFSSSGDVMFQSIHSIKVDQHGNVLVRDFYQNKLTILDSNGEVHQILGQEGKGPGEFTNLKSMFPKNDTLLINDTIQLKVELFSYQDSSYIRQKSIALGSIKGNSASILGIVNGGILFFRSKPIYAGKGGYSSYFKSTLSISNWKGEIVKDSIATYKSIEALVTEDGDFQHVPKSFGNEGYVAYNNQDKVFYIWSDSLAVDYFTLDGDRQDAFSYSLIPIEITEQEKDSVLSSDDEPHTAEMRKQFAETKPLIHAMLMDDENRLWLEIKSKNLGIKWYAFSTEGEPLLMVKKPDHSAELQDVHQNHIYWNYINDNGAPTVVKSRIIN